MRRVAIIDDNVLIRVLLRDMLTIGGYEAILVEGPAALLAQLVAARPDLALLDFRLGAWGDGLTVATAIRADPLLVQMPLIVMSAAPDVLRQHAVALADLRCQVLEKPFDLDALYALIAGALPCAQC